MLPVYIYEPINIIHFDFNVQQIEDYLSPRNELIFLEQELIPRHQIFDVISQERECRIEMRFTYRLLNSNKNICFGSYITEQVFYIKYVNDEHTKSQIEHLFNNSLFMSEQEFEKLIIKSELPRQISLPSISAPDHFALDLLKILKEDPL